MKKIRRLQTQGEGPRMLALEPQMNLTHGLTPKRLRGILELADQGDILEQPVTGIRLPADQLPAKPVIRLVALQVLHGAAGQGGGDFCFRNASAPQGAQAGADPD